MRGVEGVGDLRAEVDHGRDRHRASVDRVLQRPALQPFHDNEWSAVVRADVVNSADLRMRQRGCGARLALEPLQRVARAGRDVWEKLERDPASELGVLCFVDDAHAAAAKLLEDLVPRNRRADHDGRL